MSYGTEQHIRRLDLVCTVVVGDADTIIQKSGLVKGDGPFLPREPDDEFLKVLAKQVVSDPVIINDLQQADMEQMAELLHQGFSGEYIPAYVKDDDELQAVNAVAETIYAQLRLAIENAHQTFGVQPAPPAEPAV